MLKNQEKQNGDDALWVRFFSELQKKNINCKVEKGSFYKRFIEAFSDQANKLREAPQKGSFAEKSFNPGILQPIARY